MKCVECGKELADDAKFCSNCGAKVNIEPVCPNCGKKLTIDAKFCSECGAKIGKESGANETAEQQQVQNSQQKVELESSNTVIFVNLSDEGLFGTAGYWNDGEVEEFPRKQYQETYFSIDKALKDAKNEAEKKFGKTVYKIVVGIPDIPGYSNIIRYKNAVKNAGFSSCRFLRTTIAQALAISQNHFQNQPEEELEFGIYNYVGGNLIGAAIKTCDGVVEVAYVDFDSQKEIEAFKADPNSLEALTFKTFCSGHNNYCWNGRHIANYSNCINQEQRDEEYESVRGFTKTIFFNENCLELQDFLIQLDGKDKNYMVIDKGKVTNSGLALQAGLLSGSLKDTLLLDTTLFDIFIFTKNKDNCYESDMYIDAQTTIPTTKSISYTTTYDNQSSFKIYIEMKNPNHMDDKDYKSEFDIVNIPPAPAGVPKIDLSTSIDSNHNIRITAKILGTDIEQQWTF